MNRFRLDLLRRANGVIFQQQYFANESASRPSRPPSTQARPFTYPKNRPFRIDDPLETIKNISMNHVAILNLRRIHNEDEYIYKYVHKILEEHYQPKKLVDLPNSIHINQLNRLCGLKWDDPKAKQICNVLRDEIRSLKLDELETLLINFKELRLDIKSLVYNIDVRLNAILMYDKTIKLPEDLDRLLYLSDLLYECRVSSNFGSTLLNKARDVPQKDISDRHLLHLLFLTISQRNNHHLIPMYNRRISALIEEASIETLSTISLSYFKTQTIMKDKRMIDKLLEQATKNLSTLDPKEPAYCAIVKNIRYSRAYDNRDMVVKFVAKLLEDPDHKVMFGSAYNAVHTTKLMEAFRIYEPKLLHIMRCLLFKDLGVHFRIKDIQYALTSLSNQTYLDLRPDESFVNDLNRLVNNILDESRDDAEHQNFHLVPIVRAFVAFGYHNRKLSDHLTRLLADPNQLAKMKLVLEFDKSILLIHAAHAIEHGDTSLLELKPLLEQCAAKIGGALVRSTLGRGNNDFGSFQKIKPYMLPNTTMFKSIADSLQKHHLLNNRYNFQFQHTFAHQNYNDLVITRDLPAPGPYDTETLLPRIVPAGTNACLVFATNKCDYVDGDRRLGGYKQLVVRLMQKLGYHVLPVDLHEPNIDDAAQKIRAILNADTLK